MPYYIIHRRDPRERLNAQRKPTPFASEWLEFNRRELAADVMDGLSDELAKQCAIRWIATPDTPAGTKYVIIANHVQRPGLQEVMAVRTRRTALKFVRRAVKRGWSVKLALNGCVVERFPAPSVPHPFND